MSSPYLFFFNDTATTEIYTLSLHDALPICDGYHGDFQDGFTVAVLCSASLDRKSTRLNSSHANISYAVFCLKKKNRRHFASCVSSSAPWVASSCRTRS